MMKAKLDLLEARQRVVFAVVQNSSGWSLDMERPDGERENHAL